MSDCIQQLLQARCNPFYVMLCETAKHRIQCVFYLTDRNHLSEDEEKKRMLMGQFQTKPCLRSRRYPLASYWQLERSSKKAALSRAKPLSPCQRTRGSVDESEAWNRPSSGRRCLGGKKGGPKAGTDLILFRQFTCQGLDVARPNLAPSVKARPFGFIE